MIIGKLVLFTIVKQKFSTVCPTKLVLVRIQKKNRVQENVIVEESSTITLTWTLFLRALQYSHIF